MSEIPGQQCLFPPIGQTARVTLFFLPLQGSRVSGSHGVHLPVLGAVFLAGFVPKLVNFTLDLANMADQLAVG